MVVISFFARWMRLKVAGMSLKDILFIGLGFFLLAILIIFMAFFTAFVVIRFIDFLEDIL